ncbi:hypothetical protein CPLU01_02249 [Colletotrichum plurivorum]|uniref:Uncharacterized protein n=1 Tax=Colletotrichum plurivorum TaxID=2175906 RepID=A0A8H6KWV0_9PEZI|nr:hypothetical protein CPLU01_02249 [Colletotrichum plurivorum]
MATSTPGGCWDPAWRAPAHPSVASLVLEFRSRGNCKDTWETIGSSPSVPSVLPEPVDYVKFPRGIRHKGRWLARLDGTAKVPRRRRGLGGEGTQIPAALKGVDREA